MPYDLAIHFRDERYHKSFGGTQCLDDVMLRVIADVQRRECGSSHITYCLHIGIGLAPNSSPGTHALRVFPVPLANDLIGRHI